MKKSLAVVAILGVQFNIHAQDSIAGANASIKSNLPPSPTADISDRQQIDLSKELATVTQAFQAVKKHERAADADIFIKAVRFAIEFHEWYDKKPEDSVKKARVLLAEAATRIEALKKNQTPWMNGSGHKVLGFYSNIDDSPQPYGVEIPVGLDWGAGKKPVPMWIWLHGRGDTATDIHFIAKQMKGKSCPFNPAGAIVVEPFGRYCNGWKSAGETDVLECKTDATKRFNVDYNRIALAGFSMGGAGAWHLGAHYADQWAVVHTGAGFVDVKRYQKLTPDKMPPWYEQKLWGVYDVPDYARNFLNVPLISYSGEIDAQRDSAEYMTEVLAKEGITRPHLIGLGMGHKYHPETIKEVQRLIEDAMAKGRNASPREVHLQTRTTAYGSMDWVSIDEMERLWEDARVDAVAAPGGRITVTTKNVKILALDIRGSKLVIDGEDLGPPSPASKTSAAWLCIKNEGKWTATKDGRWPISEGLAKNNFVMGPIDEAFLRKFLFVVPDGKFGDPETAQWIGNEFKHAVQRWQKLMRGDPKIKRASELTDNDKLQNLILWGDPSSNSYLAKIMPSLPLQWNKEVVGMTGVGSFPAHGHIPVMIYPNPENHYGHGYIVINSGLTFREAHDKTNSLQNPKLPDWAILDISQPPNDESAGKVVAADFFDEHWKVKK